MFFVTDKTKENSCRCLCSQYEEDVSVPVCVSSETSQFIQPSNLPESCHSQSALLQRPFIMHIGKTHKSHRTLVVSALKDRVWNFKRVNTAQIHR